MSPVRIAVLTTLFTVVSLLIWQGYEAGQATENLPKHRYPDAAEELLSKDVKPRAVTALEQIHAMQGVPVAYQDIIIPMSARSQPAIEFARTAITHRGGPSSMECLGRVLTIHQCTLQAALPPRNGP